MSRFVKPFLRAVGHPKQRGPCVIVLVDLAQVAHQTGRSTAFEAGVTARS